MEFECEGDRGEGVVVFKADDLAVPRAFVGFGGGGMLGCFGGAREEGGAEARVLVFDQQQGNAR
jgi:hypothetical protein